MTKFSTLLTVLLISSSSYIFGNGTGIYNPKHVPASEPLQVQRNQQQRNAVTITPPAVLLILVLLPRQ